MKRFFFLLAGLFLLTSFFGCGGTNVHLGGRVTYSDTNEPLECGTVNFASDRFQARGEIKEDGRYVLGSLKESDGLPPGTYRVYITSSQRREESDKGGMPRFIPLIDNRFTNAATSGLEASVDAKTKLYDIKVERAGTGKR